MNTHNKLLKAALALAAISLAIGLFAPILTLSKFVLVKSTFSVFSGVLQLFKEGQYFLFLIIAGFSVLLPIIKLGVLDKVIFQPEVISAPTQRYLHWIQKLGKWSMLDVFVVAVLVVAVKLRAIAEVQMHYGLYAFAVSVLLTMWLSSKLSKYLQIQ